MVIGSDFVWVVYIRLLGYCGFSRGFWVDYDCGCEIWIDDLIMDFVWWDFLLFCKGY